MRKVVLRPDASPSLRWGAASSPARIIAVLTWVCLVAGGASARAQDVPLPSTIPIFPLADVMLFPGTSRPLHIFEARYREMVADALEGDRIIGMVMLQPGFEDDYDGNPPVYGVGCAGVIANVERLADGRYNILLRGLSRFRILQEDRSRSYRVAEVEPLPEVATETDRDLLRGLRPLLLELLTFVAADPSPTPDELPDDMLVNGLAQFLGMEPDHRLDLLQQDGPLPRAEALLDLLDQGALSR